MTPAEQDQDLLEYEEAEPNRLLEDSVFDLLLEKPREQILELPADTRAAFYSTLKWHARERMTSDLSEGMVIGDKTMADFESEED